jgi:hypothetical protein
MCCTLYVQGIANVLCFPCKQVLRLENDNILVVVVVVTVIVVTLVCAVYTVSN